MFQTLTLLAQAVVSTGDSATIQMAIEFAKLIFYVAGVAIASGWIVTAITQVLKWKFIAVPAQKYPVPVAIVLSVLVSIPAVYVTGLIEIAGWWSYLVIALAALLVATQSYDLIKKAIEQLRAAKK